MTVAPIITFLSDYGLEDDFVGVCHAVIAGRCPQARVIDLTHGVPRHDVRAGALILRGALPYLPVGVHLAVVDPGVGGERRAIAVTTADGRLFVGPDNGLLSPAADAAGGILEVVDIGRSHFRLEPVSATFHGRDIFAPVAAHLARGAALADAGTAVDPASLVRLDLPTPSVSPGALTAHAVYIDRFGNVQLDAERRHAAEARLHPTHAVAIETSTAGASARALARYARTFGGAAPGELLLYEDSYRRLAIAVNQGDAAAQLALKPGDQVRILPES